MVRSLIRMAVIATLITGGFFVTSSPASARHSCLHGRTGPQCKNPQATGANPRSGRTPASGADGPVCGNGRHVGNPHCRPAGVNNPRNPPRVNPTVRTQGGTVRRVTAARANRAAPRANRATAPRAGTRVVSRAGSSL